MERTTEDESISAILDLLNLGQWTRERVRKALALAYSQGRLAALGGSNVELLSHARLAAEGSGAGSGVTQ